MTTDKAPPERASYLVAGGGSGLGAACVRRLAATGRRGVIADLRPPDSPWGVDVAEHFIFCPTDVTNESEVPAALAAAHDQFGPIRGVIICAGIIHSERILGREGLCNLNAFRRVLEVNLVGTFNVLRLAAEAMHQNTLDDDGQRGVIVTTASIAADEGQIGQTAYAASKAGVAALTLPAARELGQLGIRVVSIAPGVFATPMMEQVSPERRAALEAQIPFPQRFGRPDEFAALVEHILANPMLNGSVIRLDAGLRMGPK
jgi:NAD(P)-dependent dehydrogenase (short-subunit alcohol dehydrogenase family)